MTLTNEETTALGIITQALLRYQFTPVRVAAPPSPVEAAAPAAPQAEPVHLSVKDAATFLGCSPNKVRDDVKAGNLPHYMVGKSPRFVRSKLQAVLDGEWKPPAEPSARVLPMARRPKKED